MVFLTLYEQGCDFKIPSSLSIMLITFTSTNSEVQFMGRITLLIDHWLELLEEGQRSMKMRCWKGNC